MKKFTEKIWFLSPSVDLPMGGINHFYRLCYVAEQLGISAKVISVKPYPWAFPKSLEKYWQPCEDVGFRYDMYNIPEIDEGDLIVQPEIYNWIPIFTKKVRRITYIQNWAIVTEHSWETHYWIYSNMTHFTYCFESIKKQNYPIRDKVSGDGMNKFQTQRFIESKKLKWSTVTPFFNTDDYQIKDFKDKSIEMIMFSRKSSEIADSLKTVFGNKLTIIEGVSPSKALELISNSKIIILPSPSEGLCFPAIEAILSNTLVLTWPCGAPEDYVIDNYSGFIAEFGNVDSLVTKLHQIESLIKNNPKEIQQILNNAYNLVSSTYNEENTTRELLTTYLNSLTIKPI